MTNTTKGPVDHVRLGTISAAIWANDTETGVRYGVTFERLYRDPSSGAWKSSATFNRDDLLVIAKVADLVHSRIHERQTRDRAQSRDESDGTQADNTDPKPPVPRAGGASASAVRQKATRAKSREMA